MENASKAMIMAGGVLIGILILSLAVYLFADFATTSAEINKQNEQSQITQFNSKFTSYEGKSGITIYDVITVAGYAYENNKYYENSESDKIIVILNRNHIQNYTEEQKNNLIKSEQANINSGNLSLPTYTCRIINFNENGKVRTIEFIKNLIE